MTTLTSFRFTTQVKHIQVPRVVKDFSRTFIEHGYSCYLVGGAVRNLVAGLKPTDYDFATDATPEAVMRMFKRVIPTGVKHGTVTVLYRGSKFEVTTFRIDGTYSNARHPDSVTFSPSIEEDLKRRDFTINALAVNLKTNELLDPHHGEEDLKLRIIRAIGDPVERFSEDGLRILRGLRFASQLEFSIEENTLQAIRDCRENLTRVSAERIRDEIIKILEADTPSISFKIMEETEVLSLIIPELSACSGIGQKGFHSFDVFTHSILACDGAPKENLVVRLAALLHDIGKPEVLATNEEGEPTFYQHEIVSASLASRILCRLRFPKSIEQAVCHLIKHHMFLYEETWTDSAVRRFIARVGKDALNNLFLLRMADQYGMVGRPVISSTLDAFRKRIDAVLEADSVFSLKDLAVGGNELFEEAGIPRGPIM
ncbi:MAG TPA: CCA tRNA nucleotidyltransferase, partial [Spirochaetia bacterium]|nr:CCA tRNA nucleotidyltransferase [Spirochaetia bacterium]